MNAKLAIATIVILMSAVSNAHAEGGCPPGFYPQNSPSVKACIPFPVNGGGEAEAGPVWSSRWGAIAQDPATGVVGAVANRQSKRQAKKDAIAECKSRGGSDCRHELDYTNQCVAIIQGSTAANFPHAATLEEAVKLGMSACKSRGDQECKVYYQACSMPVRVR